MSGKDIRAAAFADAECLAAAAHPMTAWATVVTAQAHLTGDAAAHATSLLTRLHREQPELGPWVRVEAWLAQALAADRLGHAGR